MKARSSLQRLFGWGVSLLLCGGAAGPGWAQKNFPRPATVESLSKQFVVQSFRTPLGDLAVPHSALAGTKNVPLEPGLLAISAERIKTALNQELGLGKGMRPPETVPPRRIILNIRPNPLQTVEITLLPKDNNWLYVVDLPNQMEPERILQALVQVLLLERTHRQVTQGETAELPRWVVEGMAEHIRSLAVEGLSFKVNTLEPPRDFHYNPLAEVYNRLQGKSSLTFDELSWSDPQPGPPQELFRDSAQLLVHQLLQTPGGRVNFRRFLEEMPRYKNWQLGFLEAFQSQFGQLREVEKWWALRLVDFSGRDPGANWTRQESLDHLKAALKVPMQISASTNEVPVNVGLSLQEVLAQAELDQQEMAFQQASHQLRSVCLHIHPQLLELADQYRQRVENYLEQRTRANAKWRKIAFLPVNLQVLRQTTSRQLDQLDNQLRSVRVEAGQVVEKPQL